MIFLSCRGQVYAALYNASGVLGQPDFVSGGATTTQSGLNGPSSVAVDTVHHRVFVVDNTNNRVLIFPLNSDNTLASTTSENASFVLGQSNFTSNSTTTPTQSGILDVEAVAYDPVNDRLFVGERTNNRILVFNVASGTLANGENASYELGQSNFTSNNTTTPTQSGLNFIKALAFDSVNQRLFAADRNNNRVLVFNVSPSSIANGESASYVLGQSDFASNSTTTPTQSGLGSGNSPRGLAYDSINQRLFVSDFINGRVLIFNVATGTIANGESASYVLGQSDFASNSTTSPTQSSILPEGLAYDTADNLLFVGDYTFYRVMVFDAATSTIRNGESALDDLGQADFTGTQNGPVSQNNPINGEGLAYDGSGHLFATDDFNNRVLEFSFITLTTASLPGGTQNSPYSQTLTTTNSQGTVSFKLFSGSLPAGLSLATSTGVISGTPTAAGSYSFTIEADDSFSTGNFIGRASYTVTIASAPVAPSPSSTPSPVVYVAASYAPPGWQIGSPSPSSSTASSSFLPVASPEPASETIINVTGSPTSQLASLQTTLRSLLDRVNASSTFLSMTFMHNLGLWSRGQEVQALQQFLITQASGPAAAKLKNHGATTLFGILTYHALVEFQEKSGIAPAGGYFGPITRALVNALGR